MEINYKCILRILALANSVHSNESMLEKIQLANSKIHKRSSTNFFKSKCNVLNLSSIFSFIFDFFEVIV